MTILDSTVTIATVNKARAAILEDLALGLLEDSLELWCGLVDPGTEDAEDIWEEYQAAVRKREGLATGVLDWATEYPDLIPANCPMGPQDEAVQMAAQDADELLAVLLHGPKWGNR